MSLCNRPLWLVDVRKDNAANKGLTLAPFSGKHLQPPLQSLPPHCPLCFFPPCQTQKQTRQRWEMGNRMQRKPAIFWHPFHSFQQRNCNSNCKLLHSVGVTSCVCVFWLVIHLFMPLLSLQLLPCYVYCSDVQRGSFRCSANDSWRRHNGQPYVHEHPIHQIGLELTVMKTISL